jgi:hypothetical protein
MFIGSERTCKWNYDSGMTVRREAIRCLFRADDRQLHAAGSPTGRDTNRRPACTKCIQTGLGRRGGKTDTPHPIDHC